MVKVVSAEVNRGLVINQIGTVTLTTTRPLVFDRYTDNRATGSFILIDPATNFTAGAQQTLPLWIYNQFRLPNTAQEVNAVAVFVIALTAIPVYLAQRLMRESGGIGGRG